MSIGAPHITRLTIEGDEVQTEKKKREKKQLKRKMKYHNRCAHGESIVLYELIGGFSYVLLYLMFTSTLHTLLSMTEIYGNEPVSYGHLPQTDCL